MKRKIIVVVFTFFVSTFAFSEHLLGLNLGTGYRNNNFEYEDFKHDVSYWTNFFGFSYTYYPSYNSVLGFSLLANIVGLDIPVYRNISDTGNNSNYHYVEKYSYPDNAYSENLRYSFNMDAALNLRFPVKDFGKSFTYLRLGGFYQLSTFDMRMERNKNAASNLSYDKNVSGGQNAFGTFAEIGRNYGKGEVSLKFVYDLLIESELTGNELIRPKSFGIVFSCRPRTWRIETQKDKDYIQSLLSKEDVYDKDKYRLYETKKETIHGIPVTVEYVRRIDELDEDKGLGKPFILRISFDTIKLGKGIPGTDDYLRYSTETVTMNFYSEEEKDLVYRTIEEDKIRRKEQKNRIAENRKLNPNKLEYQKLPVLDMATMGIAYAPNPTLTIGNIYLADRLRVFYVINRMENGDYNIGEDPSFSSYGSYQFIMKNSSSEPISDYMFADTAYLRYLGKTEVIMSNGYVRYLPYFEMIQKNPHSLRRLIEECEKW